MGTPVLPAPPPCPKWCDAHAETDVGWKVDPYSVSRMCHREVEVQGGASVPVKVALHRLATVEHGAVLEEPVYVSVDGRMLDAGQAGALADVLQSAARMAKGSGWLAA